MSKLKVGDRVAVYYGSLGRRLCRVAAARADGLLEVDDSEILFAHPKQCRKLKPRPDRKVWVPTFALKDAAKVGADQILADHGCGVCVRVRPPTDEKGWVEFVEVRRKR